MGPERPELLDKEVLELASDLLDDLGSLLLDLSNVFLDCLSRVFANGVATLGDDLSVVAGSTAVPGKNVGGVSGDIGQGTLGGNSEELGLELSRADGGNRVSRVRGRLERQKVGKETSDVGGSHGGAGDGVDCVLAASPG